ncbi:MAG: sensor histidine kinase [Gammaproteobacteria bacterium]
MNAPATSSNDSELERLVAQRTADLTELLGHVMTCWDEDRRLLARKMHDSMGSSMTALTMHLGLLTQQMPQEKNLQDRAAQMKTLLTNIINANRDMQLGLWNDKLEFLGIKSALSELVRDFGSAHRIKARASLPDEDASLPRPFAVALLRCAEEGLRNVLAHSQASEVDVILDDNEDEVMLTVRDNGVGPSGWDTGRLDCHGIRLLRERASFLGGSLDLQAGQSAGSQLTLILPKQPAPAVPA